MRFNRIRRGVSGQLQHHCLDNGGTAMKGHYWWAAEGRWTETQNLNCDAVWFTHVPTDVILYDAVCPLSPQYFILFHKYCFSMWFEFSYIFFFFFKWRRMKQSVSSDDRNNSQHWGWWDLRKGIPATWFATSDTAIKCSKSHRPWQ